MELSRSPLDGCRSVSSSCRPAADESLLKLFDTGCLVIGNVADCIVGAPDKGIPVVPVVVVVVAAVEDVVCPSGNWFGLELIVLLLKFLLLLCSVVVVAVDPIGLPMVDTVVILLLWIVLGECNRLLVGCDTDS